MKAQLLLLAAVLALSGCTHHYVIRMNSGSEFTTQGKPKLKNGVYTYKDALGREGAVPAGSVAQVAPASMAEDDSKESKFKGPTPK